MGKKIDNNQRGSKKIKRKSVMRELLEMLLYMVIVLVLAFIIVNYVGQRTKVVGSSMEYTLSNADQLIVDKVTYRLSDPKRFDIIVFPYDKQKEIYYIKRIIGMPGETVQIKGSDIYINGKVLNEGYGKEKIEDAGRASEPITLDTNEYFVMGDNRNFSSDSRDQAVGSIKRKDIVGRAWIRIWPLDHFGILKHQ